MRTFAILLCLTTAAHAQLAVMHTNGTIVSPTNVAALRTSIGVPSTFGTGSNSVVGGGLSNQASGVYSAVVGGLSNTASGSPVTVNGTPTGGGLAFVGGGDLNAATGWYSAIVGGHNNEAKSWSSFIGGGNHNTIDLPPVAWDTNSPVPNSFSAIVGGLFNTNTGYISIIGGGLYNKVDSSHGFVGGGANNEIRTNANFSTIPGGRANIISAHNSFAAGSYANASHEGAFVWSDNSSTNSFSSTNNNSFNVRAHGGLSLDLGTNGIAFRNETNAAVTRTNLSLGWPALTNANSATSLLGFTANGQVVYANTNALTFTNGIRVGSSPTNAPASGQIAMQQAATNVASEITMWSADQTTSASLLFKKQNIQTNWSITSWGNNVVINNNNEHTLRDDSQPASYWSIENNYDSSGNAPQYGSSIAETYFTTVTSNGFNMVRGFGIIGNHQNPSNGLVSIAYPVSIDSTPEKRLFSINHGNFWDQNYSLAVKDDTTGGGLAAIFLNRSTNTNATIRTDWAMVGAFSSDVFWIRKRVNRVELRQANDGFTALSTTTNGVLIGGDNDSNALSRVHLGGNTRVDGAISFNNATNAATTVTNLGLGGGITTNVSSGTLQFSNGILVGHTP